MSQCRPTDFSISKCKLVIGSFSIALLLLLTASAPLWELITYKPAFASTSTRRTYTTNFTRTENPISESGNWVSGRAGLDWADVRTRAGLAFGTQSRKATTAPGEYDDSTALLTGPWGPDQTAQATVYSANPTDKAYEEVELRLRSNLSAHRATGYEISFRCLKSPKAYLDIVRWNGPLGSFTYIRQVTGSKYGVTTGDVIKASIRGNVITVFINDVQMLQASDNSYASGSPGIGFYIENPIGTVNDYGLTGFTAAED